VSVQINRAFTAVPAFSALSASTKPRTMADRTGRTGGSSADRVGLLYPAQECESPEEPPELRSVGEIKPSWKWTLELQTAEPNRPGNIEFRQVLSQVHHYMNVHETRYGYVLTDREFVAIRRCGQKFGDIMISKPVLWEEDGSQGMSLALASWFLHMLAGDDKEWHAEFFPRNEAVDSHDEAGSSVEPTEQEVVEVVTTLEEGVGGAEGEKRPALRKSKRLAGIKI
jgi:hypothetical protein